jgi:hypothetical protein
MMRFGRSQPTSNRKGMRSVHLLSGIVLVSILAGATTWGQILEPPNLSSPANGSTGQPTSISLDWQASSGALSYQVQVATAPSFQNPVADQIGVTETQTVVNGLSGNTTYYWRVRAQALLVQSAWSLPWSFTIQGVPPVAPVLVLPGQGATGQSTSLLLAWSQTTGAETYHVQLSTSATFANPIINDSGIVPTSYSVTGLAGGTQYFWKVRGKNAGGIGAWSEARNFTTAVSLPATPTLTAPADGSTGQPTTTSLQWNSTSGAARYHVQVSTDVSFSVLTLSDSSVEGRSRQVQSLADSTRYYWRVRGVNDGGSGPWSVVWNFRTASGSPAAPMSPQLLVPANASTNQPTSLDLHWQSAQRAATYKVQMSDSPTYAQTVLDTTGIVDTTLRVRSLQDSTQYFWHVKAVNAGGESNWSASRNFTTAPDGPGSLEAPVLLSPANGSVNMPTTVTVTWQEVIGATSYQVQVSTDETFLNPEWNQSGLTGTSYTVNGLANSTTYYWRVRSISLLITSSWSGAWTFFTGGIPPTTPTLLTPPDNSVHSPAPLVLSWNASSTATRYAVQIAATASFTSPLVDDSSLAGNTYNATNLDTGVTFYWRVRAGNAGGWSGFSVAWSFIIRSSAPAMLTLNWTAQFPEHPNATEYTPEDYQILGLPGASNASLQTYIGGQPGTDWQAYWDNGSPNEYLTPYGNGAPFMCVQGRAFWIVKKGNWTIDATVPAPARNADLSACIDLHPGWNLVANPFDVSVPWSAVQTVNGITDPIYGFNAGFIMADDFQPYLGYYFYNSGGMSVLCIPPPGDRMGKPHANAVYPTAMRHDGWQINVQLAAGNSIDGTTWLGASPVAENGLDQFDFRKPRAIGSLPGVYFSRPEWDSAFSTFATDIRRADGEIYEWNLIVTGNNRREASLTFNGLSGIPDRFEAYLLDEKRMMKVDIRETPHYELKLAAGCQTLRVVVGEEKRVAELLRSFRLPGTFKIEGNFPNPFNPSTSLAVQVPGSEHFDLKIYDVLGREVRLLFSGSLSAGRHFIEWDGLTNHGVAAASGVYFSRLVAESGAQLIQKMTLMK